MRIAMTIVVALITIGAASAELTDLLADPGFEALGEDGQFTGWAIPAGTPGAVSVATDETEVFVGAQAALIVAGEADGRHFAQIRSTRVRPMLGAHYRAAVWVKGSGSARVAVTEQLRVRRATDQEWADTWSEPVALTDEWVELVADATISNPKIARVFATVEVEGEGAMAWVDDCGLAIAGALTVTPPYAMVREGDSFSFSVAVQSEGEPLTAGALSIKTTNGDKAADEELAIGGTASELVFTAPDALEERVFKIRVGSEDAGASDFAYVHVVDAATYAKFEAAAAATKLDGPAHLLFLGCSLTDFQRDYNYTDEVAFWLWKTHAGAVTYRNAGVGGDYITRTWPRLDGDQSAYRAYMFDDLFAPAPTHAFIFLGHNDTKLKPKPEYTSPDDYTDPVVSFENWDTHMRMAIGKIQTETGAKVTVLSSTSSVYEVCAARVVANIAAGKSGGSLFGKPEVMEQFNALARAFAADTGSSFVDVYTPMFEYPDKPSLFTRDGVHMNMEGNWIVALEVLKSFGE